MILVAGVGYSYLRDLSFGPRLVEVLRTMPWPPDVVIEDFSYGPIAILHWFEEAPGRAFDAAILFGAVERGREPGTLSVYRWSGAQRAPDEVQARVAEAVTGVVGLENLLVIADHFGALPPSTWVVELEPVETMWGTDLSTVGHERLREAVDLVAGLVDRTRAGRAEPAGNPTGDHERASAVVAH